MDNKIYLDNASTTMMSAEVVNAMMPVFNDVYGNPSSTHEEGRRASKLLDDARDSIAETLNVSSSEIYFTSGGTEANNWAIIGLAYANASKGKHIITTKIEHHSVLDACAFLETQGFEVTYLNVDKFGFINFAEFLGAFRKDTILVSIMSANNELGTVQNLKAIGITCRENDVIFHTDAVQLYGNMTIDPNEMYIDALTISAHKIYGPKGVGALYLRRGIKINNIIYGGMQESGKRGGTESVMNIVGFAKACEVAYRDIVANNYKINQLESYLIEKLKEIPDCEINALTKQKVPQIVSVSFDAVDKDTLLMMLDLNGVYCSAGSACMAGSSKPSHVLQAINMPISVINSTIRISLSKNNTFEEIDLAVNIIRDCVEKIRAYSPFYTTRKNAKRKKNV